MLNKFLQSVRCVSLTSRLVFITHLISIISIQSEADIKKFVKKFLYSVLLVADIIAAIMMMFASIVGMFDLGFAEDISEPWGNRFSLFAGLFSLVTVVLICKGTMLVRQGKGIGWLVLLLPAMLFWL